MKLKKRKNLFLTTILTIFLWGTFSLFVYFIPPANNFLLFIFYSLLFLSTFFTAALIFSNSRRGFLFASFLILFLIFRYYQIAHPINIALLGGILISLEVYFSK